MMTSGNGAAADGVGSWYAASRPRVSKWVDRKSLFTTAVENGLTG